MNRGDRGTEPIILSPGLQRGLSGLFTAHDGLELCRRLAHHAECRY